MQPGGNEGPLAFHASSVVRGLKLDTGGEVGELDRRQFCRIFFIANTA